MFTRFATVMAGLRPDDTARAGAVEASLGVRARAGADGHWEDADAIRRALSLLSVQVCDTPGETVWEPLSR